MSNNAQPASYVPDVGKPDFFRSAPSRIGTLVSEHTSLAVGIEPEPFANKAIRAGLITSGLMVLVIACAVLLYIYAPTPVPLYVLIPLVFLVGLILGGLVLAFVVQISQFSHYCAFVGANGAAYFTCAGDRERIKEEQSFSFDDAADLRVAMTHHYYNNSYTQTTFAFTWTDEDGKEVFKINGSHNAEFEMPPATNLYHFAQEAEQAWSIFLLNKIIPDLNAGRSHRFRLSGDNFIDLRGDSLKLHLHGNVQKFTAADLAEMRIQQGQISLKEPGSREGWFTSSGVHSFTFGELSNARVFILLMDQVFNIPITG